MSNSLLSMPVGERALAEERPGGPAGEVDSKGHAMAVEAREDEDVFATGMMAEDRTHAFGKENGAAPAMRDAHGFECRMKIADALLEHGETIGGGALVNVHGGKRVSIVLM